MRRLFQNSIFCMMVACFFFACMGAFVKFAMQEVSFIEAVFWRSAFAAVLIGFAIWRTKTSFIGNNPVLLLGRAFAGFAAITLNFYAISHIPLGDAAILNQSSPIFIALFSVLLLGETFSFKTLFWSLFSLVGVAILLKFSPLFSLLSKLGLTEAPHHVFHWSKPAFAGLMSSVMAAFAYIAIRQLHATDSFLTMVFYFSMGSSLLSIPLLVSHFRWPSWPSFISLFLAGLVGTVAQILMTYAYKNEEASVISAFSYVMVFFSFLLGMIFFGELPDRYALIGTLLIVTACVALVRSRRVKVRSGR